MLHGLAFGLGIAVALVLAGSILHRGLGRTIIGLLKGVFWSVATVAAFVVVVAVLFRLIAVGNQPEPQASAGAPAASWLDDK